MKIGFIGLGIMGRPMALNLKKAGHDLVVPDRKSLTDDIRTAATVVADAHMQDAVAFGHPDVGGGGVSMLGSVGQRLADRGRHYGNAATPD